MVDNLVEMACLKQCRECARFLPVGEFYAARTAKGGVCGRCKVCAREYSKKWRKENTGRVVANRLDWYQKNKGLVKVRDRARRVAIRNSPEKREKQRLYLRDKSRERRSCSKFRARDNVRRAVSAALRGRAKSASTFQILGYSLGELVDHLEKQFQPGMQWSNYGDWHIDHIVPVSSFNSFDQKVVRLAWGLANLRPLWAEENLSKSSKRTHLI